MNKEINVIAILNEIDLNLKNVNDQMNDDQLQQNIIFQSILPNDSKIILEKLNSIYQSISKIKLNDFKMVKEIKDLNEDKRELLIDSVPLFTKALKRIAYENLIAEIKEVFSKVNNHFVTILIKHNQCRFKPHRMKTLLENNLQLLYNTLNYYIKQKVLKDKDKKIYISQYNYLKTKFEKFYNSQFAQSTNNNL